MVFGRRGVSKMPASGFEHVYDVYCFCLHNKARRSRAIGTDALRARTAVQSLCTRCYPANNATTHGAKWDAVAGFCEIFLSCKLPARLTRTNTGACDSIPRSRAQDVNPSAKSIAACAGRRSSAQPAYGWRTVLQIIDTSISVRVRLLSQLNLAQRSWCSRAQLKRAHCAARGRQ